MADSKGNRWLVFLLASIFGAGGLAACHRAGSLAGDHCEVSDDCRSPLVCSTKADPDAVAGICVYPGALPLDAGMQDAAAVDASLQDGEMSLDSGLRRDAGTQDASLDADMSPDAGR